MTGTVWRKGRSAVRSLERADLAEVLQLCAKTPIDSVLAAARFIELGAARGRGLEAWGWPRFGPLRAVCWAGANLVPVLDPDLPAGTRKRALSAFASHAVRTRNRSSSIVGEAGAVLEVWRHVSRVRVAREVRHNQPSMIMDADAHVEPNVEVRVTHPSEFEMLFPASVAMFTEEVGYSPIGFDGGISYGSRVRYLMGEGRSYVLTERGPGGEDEVVFKAEVGALTEQVAQIQGVWVAPKYRGRGISVPAMAAVVNMVRAEHAPVVSLYVNDYNEVALRLYRSVGFREVGAYATVLF